MRPARPDPAPPDSAPRGADGDAAALARGGRTNFLGFLLRLVARLPFLYVAGRWYGADTLGRFAYAVLVVELAAQLATMGLKRGLAETLAEPGADPHRDVWDAVMLATLTGLVLAAVLVAAPQLMFPSSAVNGLDRLFPLVVVPIAVTEIALAAQAYRFDVATTVRARAVVEPWTISLAAVGLAFYSTRDGLILSYAVAMIAASATALWPFVRGYGGPRGWRPDGARLSRMARRNAPLAAADAIEWGTRRLDLAILGLFAAPAIVGVYYVAQQVASLPQKLKTSFDPILGPVIARNITEHRLSDIAVIVSRVGFWIVAMQTGVALALGIPAEAILGLVGPTFVAGAAALALLLAAEVAAATAVVSESALVYLARHRNMALSAATIVLQGVLSVLFVLAARRAGLADIHATTAVALALGVALATASIIKARFLSRLLAAPVGTWRPALVPAIGLAALIGWGATRAPEWVELVAGVPAILLTYGVLVWRLALDPEDRALLRAKAPAPDPVPAD